MRLLYKASMSSDDFAESWPYASKIKEELNSTGYETNFACPPRSFKSGRPIKVVTFYSGHGDARRVIEQRDGMKLMSKRTGRTYDVVRANPKQSRTDKWGAGRPLPAEARFDLDDLVDEIAA